VKKLNLTHLFINDKFPVLEEVLTLLIDSLRAAGVETSVSNNTFLASCPNLVLGVPIFLPEHLMQQLARRPTPTIVMQTEMLSDTHGFLPSRPYYIDYLRTVAEVWDYSETNLAFLHAKGLNHVHTLTLGYLPSLDRVPRDTQRDLDVLFIGVVTPRRGKILQALLDRGLNVAILHNVFGAKRDEYLARARIVLNIHQFDLPQLEQVRLSYLLNNECFVVSESSSENPYGQGVVFADYDALVDTCVRLSRPEAADERAHVARTGWQNLQAIPMVERLRELTARLD